MTRTKATTLALALFLGGAFAGATINSALAERQPRMVAALRALRTAQSQLQLASADKGGHRVKAIELTKAAIAEVEAGIAFDNAH